MEIELIQIQNDSVSIYHKSRPLSTPGPGGLKNAALLKHSCAMPDNWTILLTNQTGPVNLEAVAT